MPAQPGLHRLRPSCSAAWVSSPSRTVRASSASSRFCSDQQPPACGRAPAGRTGPSGPRRRAGPARPRARASGSPEPSEHMYEEYRFERRCAAESPGQRPVHRFPRCLDHGPAEASAGQAPCRRARLHGAESGRRSRRRQPVAQLRGVSPNCATLAALGPATPAPPSVGSRRSPPSDDDHDPTLDAAATRRQPPATDGSTCTSAPSRTVVASPPVEPDVVAVDVDVDEPAHLAGLVADPPGEHRVLGGQRVEQRRRGVSPRRLDVARACRRRPGRRAPRAAAPAPSSAPRSRQLRRACTVRTSGRWSATSGEACRPRRRWRRRSRRGCPRRCRWGRPRRRRTRRA